MAVRPTRPAPRTLAAMTVSVIIPTLNAAGSLPDLLRRLARQTAPPAEVLIVDSSSDDATAALATEAGCRVVSVERASFDHGGTRNRAAASALGDVLLFMTQDATPRTDRFIATLTAPLATPPVAAAFARQVARPDAPPTDQYLRLHNYPPPESTSAEACRRPESDLRCSTADPRSAGSRRAASVDLRMLADVPRLGIRALMLSNVAAAVRRDAFEAVGRFPDRTILNEDMLLAARLLRGGYALAYVADDDAAVLHSHRYRLRQHLGRYFDIGVFMRTHADELGAAATSGDGLRFVRSQLAWLVRNGHAAALPLAVAEAAAKWLGYQLGRRHDRLPHAWRPRLSMHPRWWSDRH